MKKEKDIGGNKESDEKKKGKRMRDIEREEERVREIDR